MLPVTAGGNHSFFVRFSRRPGLQTHVRGAFVESRSRRESRGPACSFGWPQLNAVFEHGFAYARSVDFYNATLLWQWMRLPGDVVFAIGALLMAWDFVIKVGPLFPRLARRLQVPTLEPSGQPAE